MRAAWMEAASLRRVGEIRGRAGDADEAPQRPAQRRKRVEQAARVRMLRRGLKAGGRCGLDDLARVHDRDPVGELDQQRQVVGDEQDSEAELLLEVLHLLEDLALHDDVERGGRLVHDQELGLEGQGHGDDHALAHAAGELVRESADPTRVDTDDVEQLARACQSRLLRDALVRAHHVDELVADTHDRVERVHRALKDHRDVAPPVAAQLLALLRDEVVAAEEDAAARNARRRPQDLHHGVGDGALAAARLACEAHDLACMDGQVDGVDRTHAPVAGRVLDGELPQLDDRLAPRGRHRRHPLDHLGHRAPRASARRSR
jgi:hypothetical protein